MDTPQPTAAKPPLRFFGGLAGSLAPFVVFLAGVAWLGVRGAPDERGLWPVLVAALALGLVLTQDREQYSETLIAGMSQPIVMIMILAWLLSGVLSVVLSAAGFVEALIWVAQAARLSGGAYAAAACLACCFVSMATGTSLGTILVCGPLLYPAGSAVGADPAWLLGGILAGATFGDSLSPISDTTIASAGTQGADIAGVVRSRLKYALPAAALAVIGYAVVGGAGSAGVSSAAASPSPRGLPMIGVPLLVIGLLLRKRHLVEGLLFGVMAAVAAGLAFGLLSATDLLSIDANNFTARGLILKGLERGVGISIFTLLLAGLVASLQATEALTRLVAFARAHTRTPSGAEWWVFGVVTVAVLLTTHSVVAILAVGAFTREMGGRFGLSAYRRANLLDLTVCTYPFLLPYFLPTLLSSSASASGLEAGMPRLSPLSAGIHNLYSWLLLATLLIAIVTGFGRGEAAPEEPRPRE